MHLSSRSEATRRKLLSHLIVWRWACSLQSAATLKLFNASRHATLTQTLQDARVRAVPIMQWLVPGVEFSGGCALIVGVLSALAAFRLFVICLFAFKLDAIKRIDGWKPINRADWIGDVLYLPEALYCIGLTVVMLA